MDIEIDTIRLMEAFGIRNRQLIRELSEGGFDLDTFRVLYLVPLIQIAWSDGDVSPREREKVLEIAGLHGIKAGSAAHVRLRAWLNKRRRIRFSKPVCGVSRRCPDTGHRSKHVRCVAIAAR